MYKTAICDPQVDRGRRKLLKGISAGVLGCGLANWLALEAKAKARASAGKARNVLVIYEEGGISQMNTWDPKPDALLDHRSPFAPISTQVPGIQFTSLMPNLARHADMLAVVRSMTSNRVAGISKVAWNSSRATGSTRQPSKARHSDRTASRTSVRL